VVVALLALILAGPAGADRLSEAELARLEAEAESRPRPALESVTARLRGATEAGERAQLLNLRASALIYLSELDEARAVLAEAEEAARRASLPLESATTSLHRATILFRTSDYGEAYAEISRAIQAFGELGEKRRLARANSRAFTILTQLGDYERALDFGKRALALAEEAGDTFSRGAYLSNMAYFHYRKQEYDRMLDSSKRALAAYEAVGETSLVRYPLINGGVALLELGRPAEAEEFLLRARAIAIAGDDRVNETVTRKFLARTWRTLGQTGRALPEAEAALALARQIGNRFEVKNVLLELGAIHEAAGRPERGYRFLRDGLTLLEEIQGAEVHRKVAAVQERLEIEKREGQIRLLRKEQELDDLALRNQRTVRNFLIALLAVALAAGAGAYRAYVQKKRAAETIGRQNAELLAIDRIARDINKEVDLRALIESILRHSLEHFPQARRGGFLTLSDEDSRYRSLVSFGYPEAALEKVSLTDEVARARYVEAGEEVAEGLHVVRRPGALAGLGEAFRPAAALLVFVIRDESATLGYLVLESTDDPAAFDQIDVRQVKTLHEHIISAVQKARRLRQVERLSRTDPLTRLANRRHVQERLALEVERAARYETPFLVAMCDLDDFKKVNDTLGHDCGDEVLRSTARLLSENLRRTDLVGRWGGEEFLVLLPETEREGGRIALEKVRAKLEALPLVYAGAPLRVTVSIGLAAFVRGERLEDLVARADAALYEAKRSGKNRVVVSAG
jgi:diguanylate cyclase (GGDEF)-like protein